ncbi:hypothetical protein Ae707Ps1_4324c [Pseudonocardia sp. Ae707_Ps1]|jgi:hypothetical protein|nr:hypothetical protein Ae707Ps1_4324c [Pseudonocardia sp. Ae707_Ps1]
MTTSARQSHLSTRATHATEPSTGTERDFTEQTIKSPRSKRSHRGITIRREWPASGRPLQYPGASGRHDPRFMIVSGWSGC